MFVVCGNKHMILVVDIPCERPCVVYVWGVCVASQLLDAHLWNSTCCRTATLTAPLLLTSGLLRHETVLHSYGTNPQQGWGTTCDSANSRQLIVLPHWNTRLLAP